MASAGASGQRGRVRGPLQFLLAREDVTDVDGKGHHGQHHHRHKRGQDADGAAPLAFPGDVFSMRCHEGLDMTKRCGLKEKEWSSE
jgi:hypothetical protein